MAFDGFTTKAVISELNTVLIGAKVNKVFEPSKNEIILNLYNLGNNYALDISTNPDYCRICLTNHTKQNPQNAYNFCMLLRKYLVGSKILKISNYDLERTVEIQFEAYNELNDIVVRKLFIEIMSRQSNIILTNENNVIIDTLKHFDNNVRELLPAHNYTFTPIKKVSFLNQNFEEFKNTINSSEKNSLSSKLVNCYIGFSKPFISNILNVLQISEQNYTNEDLENLYKYINKIIENFGTQNISLIENRKNYFLDLVPSEKNLAINSFLDDYYFFKEQENVFTSSRNNLLKIISSHLKKVYKKLENINSKLKECEEMETLKLYGELLTANLYRINQNDNLEEIELENYYDNYNKIIIPLDKKISVHKNIEKYFKRYNKLKNALSIVSVQKKEAEKELDYIQSIVFSLDNAKTFSDINEIYEEISENLIIKKDFGNKNLKPKSKSKEIEFEKQIINEFTVYIGKNNLQNDYLTLKFANKNDIWFHVQKLTRKSYITKKP